MILVTLTVVIIAILIAALAIYLFAIGRALSHIAMDLKDCSQNVRQIYHHADVIGPGIARLNKIGGDLLGAMPLLIEGADGVAAKITPAPPTPATSVGYMDV